MAIVYRSWVPNFLATIIVAVLAGPAIAQEPTPPEAVVGAVEAEVVAQAEAVVDDAAAATKKPFVRPAHLIVLRLPIASLAGQMDRQIDFQTPVRDVILGTPVSGVAHLIARPQVKLEPSDDKARFQVVFSGTVHSRTVGNGGPALVYGHSVTRFTATTEVAFEPGKGFQMSSPTLQASTQCFTDRIDSTRGGLVGRIVQRRAAEEVASKQTQVTAIAREKSMRRISAAFEKYMDQRLARLNKAVELQIMLADLRTGEGTRRLRASTTATHLQLADVIDNQEAAIELPILAANASAHTPVELWVHGSVVPPEVAKSLEAIFTNPDQSAIVNGLAALPGTLGKKAAAVITALVSDNKVGVQQAGDWVVVQLSSPEASRVVAAAPAAPTRR